MKLAVCADTDIGVKRQVNQDSVLVKKMLTPQGPAALAVICDGMGGLQYGEVASMSIVSAFSQWADLVLPGLACREIEDSVIRNQWMDLLRLEHDRIAAFADTHGVHTGSTVVALLATQSRYYALSIGDSRLYRLDSQVSLLTQDHTLVAEEVRKGNMTVQQAQTAPMRSVLTKCVGVGDDPRPDLFFGTPKENEIFLLCSDGFYNRSSAEELYAALLPGGFPPGPESVLRGIRHLIETDKLRGELDNISAAAIITY